MLTEEQIEYYHLQGYMNQVKNRKIVKEFFESKNLLTKQLI